jgi:hypothetical protein
MPGLTFVIGKDAVELAVKEKYFQTKKMIKDRYEILVQKLDYFGFYKYRYTMSFGFILGDIRLIFDFSKERCGGLQYITCKGGEYIDAKIYLDRLFLMDNLYALMSMTEEEFAEKMTNNDPEYLELLSQIVIFIKKVLIKDVGTVLNEMKAKQIEDHFTNRLRNKTLKLLEDDQLLMNIIKLLQGVKYKVMTKAYLFESVMSIVDSLSKIIDPKIFGLIQKILKALTGVENVKDPSKKQLTSQERVQLMLEALLEMYFPDLLGSYKLILKLANLTFDLTKATPNPGEMQSKLQSLSEEIGMVFGVNAQEINGIMGIIHGDFEAIVRMATPIASIDPTVFYLMKND